MNFHSIDDKGDIWEMACDSLQRGVIKNVLKVDEECDELTPQRQWVRTTLTMPNKNTIELLRIYKNGTQAHVIIEVKPSDPDLLIANIHVDDVATVITAKRIKE